MMNYAIFHNLSTSFVLMASTLCETLLGVAADQE
jgi:hypothetical protein